MSGPVVDAKQGKRTLRKRRMSSAITITESETEVYRNRTQILEYFNYPTLI